MRRATRSTASADAAGSRTGPTSSWLTVRPSTAAAQPVDVVGVEVGEHDGVEGGDPEAGQAAVDQRRVGAGVDEDRPVRAAAQHDGVALADVADDDAPPVGRPGEHAGRDQRCRDDEQPRRGRAPGGPRPRRPARGR